MLTPVTEKYLFNTNYLNIPVGYPGPMGTLTLKKGVTSHLDMGYQFDYLRVQGEVATNEGDKLEVLSQIYVHSFQVRYNFKKDNKIKPPFNYFLYFKLGGTFLKNNPVNYEQVPPKTIIQKSSIPQAFVYGLGAGINYQLNDNFSLTGSLDINNTTNGVGKIIQFPKIFYSNHINYYSQLSFGLSWCFSLRSNNSDYLWYDESRGIR